MFKVSNKDTRTVSLLLISTYLIRCSSVSIVNIEQINAACDTEAEELMEKYFLIQKFFKMKTPVDYQQYVN